MVDFYKQTHDELAARLHTSLEDGLSYDALQKAQADYGRNELKLKGTPIWRKIVEPFWNIFVAVLLVALGISLYAGEYIDASVIAAVVTINAVIFWIQEYSTGRVLRALKQHDTHVVAVVRQGDSLRIPTAELVPGDLIELSEGQKVPADARVVVAESFSVSEAVLTGESIGVHKYDAHIAKDTEIYAQRNMVFQGTFVLTGTATALVVATGNNTEFGKIATLASTQERAPMQQKIDTLAGTLTKIIAGISITVFVLALLRGVEVSEAGRFVIAMAVSPVPEGLPEALSIILVLAMRRMARRKALVRSMQAIENV
ncbi:HAD-IC family P-type ATPase, partial [Candidatus Saccharibacteria bacterium]|nr:HAD-IC family P-type ATPase [Candidatus Saccharibacteria bacterium]